MYRLEFDLSPLQGFDRWFIYFIVRCTMLLLVLFQSWFEIVISFRSDHIVKDIAALNTILNTFI